MTDLGFIASILKGVFAQSDAPIDRNVALGLLKCTTAEGAIISPAGVQYWNRVLALMALSAHVDTAGRVIAKDRRSYHAACALMLCVKSCQSSVHAVPMGARITTIANFIEEHRIQSQLRRAT